MDSAGRVLATTWVPLAVAAWLIVLLGILTHVRNFDYESPLRMWTDIVVKRQDNPRALLGLANALMSQDRLAEAIPYLRLAVQLSPDYASAHHHLATIFLRQGQAEDALYEFRKTVALDPTLAHAHSNLGSLLMDRRELTQAEFHLREAIRLKPNDPIAPLNLGMTLQLQENWQGAADAYRRAVVLRPQKVDSRRGLAYALGRLGRNAESRKEYEEALRLDPRWPVAALLNAWDLATSPYPGHRYGILAVQFALQAGEATGADDPHTLDVLAAAYAESGRLPRRGDNGPQGTGTGEGPRPNRSRCCHRAATSRLREQATLPRCFPAHGGPMSRKKRPLPSSDRPG